MIRRIANVSITKQAALALDREKATIRLRPGDVFALIYVSSYVNADGSTVTGFQPGYMASAFPRGADDTGWMVAQLSSGAQFHFMPTRFVWRADAHYVVDLIGSLFSIEPMPLT